MAFHDTGFYVLRKLCEPCDFQNEETLSSDFCKECEETYCSDCARRHLTYRKTHHHTVQPIEKRAKNCDPCAQTQSESKASFVCKECLECYCESCSSHHVAQKWFRNHTVYPLIIPEGHALFTFTLSSPSSAREECDVLQRHTEKEEDLDNTKKGNQGKKSHLQIVESRLSSDVISGHDQERGTLQTEVEGNRKQDTPISVCQKGNTEVVELSTDSRSRNNFDSNALDVLNDEASFRGKTTEKLLQTEKDVTNPRRQEEMASSKQSFSRLINTTFPYFLHFDTFCYAFPKAASVREAFSSTVNGLETLMKSENTIPVREPSQRSLKDAEELVADMRKRFQTQGTNGILRPEYGSLEICLSDDKVKELDEEMVNSLPHYTVFAVGGGKKIVKSNWAGQILVNVNPVLNMMRVNFFEYNPQYSKAALDSVESDETSEKLWEEETKNMQLFETTRQLALQIPLKKVSGVQLVADDEDVDVGLLEISLIPPEQDFEDDKSMMFLQRFVATNMKHYNKMKERTNFLPFSLFESPPYTLMLGGIMEELSDIQAMLVTTEPRLKLWGERQQTGEDTPKQNYQTNRGNKLSSRDTGPDENDQQREKVGLTVKSRRKSILDVLLKYNIISMEKYKEVLDNPKKIVGRTRKPVNNYLGGLEDLEPCFHDYINFYCEDLLDLECLLSTPLRASDSGQNLKAKFLGVDKSMLVKLQSNAILLDGKASEADLMDNIQIGHFIALNKESELFFSFCNRSVEDRVNIDHCRECLKCVEWRYWHCPACNRCSYGLSMPSCDNCGRRKDDRDEMIRPLSLKGYRSDREGQYDVLLGDDDMPVLSPFQWEYGGPPLEEEDNVFTSEEFQAILTAAKGWDVIQLGESCTKRQEFGEVHTTEAADRAEEESMEVAEPALEEKVDDGKMLIRRDNVNEGVSEKRKMMTVLMEEGSENQPMKKARHNEGNAPSVSLSVLLSDPLGLIDQASTLLGPAKRRKASRLRGRKPRPGAEEAREKRNLSRNHRNLMRYFNECNW